MNFLSNYFFLSEGKVIINGKKNSILMDLEYGKIYYANPAARCIINLGEQGLETEEALKKLSLTIGIPDTLSFLKELSDKEIILFSDEPKQHVPNKWPQPKLDFLWIEVTPRCNLRCIHCYAEAESDNDKAEQPMCLSLEELKDLIDDAARLNCQRLQLTGGEPMLRDDLEELIKHAKDKGFKFIEIFTNGTLFTESMVRFVAKENVHVAMSIYSYRADTHEAITRVPGSFDKTLNCLKLLLAYGVSTRCAVIAMKQNENQLDATSYFLSRLGVNSRPPDPIPPSGRGRGIENWPQTYASKFYVDPPKFFGQLRSL